MENKEMQLLNIGGTKTGNIELHDLPSDILMYIMEKLCLGDQISVRYVWKSWQAFPLDILPWVLTFEISKYQLRAKDLYDPSGKKAYQLEKVVLPPEKDGDGYLFHVHAAKFGWMLVSKREIGSGYMMFFLYNPFRNETIKLPNLMTKSGIISPSLNSKGCKATFSTIPTSPDCVFIVVHGSYWIGDEISISLFRKDDEAWKTYTFKGRCMRELEDVIYCEGIFFCVFADGMLGALDIASHTWSLLPIDTSQVMSLPKLQDHEDVVCNDNIVESNGELLLVRSMYNWKPWHVFRFDRKQMAWVKEALLGNRALFLGNHCTSYSVPAAGEISSLAGRIYFNSRRRSSFYQFKNNSRHRSSKFNPLKCKYYPMSTKRNYYRIWITPFS